MLQRKHWQSQRLTERQEGIAQKGWPGKVSPRSWSWSDEKEPAKAGAGRAFGQGEGHGQRLGGGKEQACLGDTGGMI